ncbi:MAG: hypothetical protein ACT4NP_02445, partial [Pseudonocardiales bacterium]
MIATVGVAFLVAVGAIAAIRAQAPFARSGAALTAAVFVDRDEPVPGSVPGVDIRARGRARRGGGAVRELQLAVRDPDAA